MKKFTIIGAGSTYTPELIEGLSKFKDTITFDEIMLYDVDEKRLEIMLAFVRRYAKKLGYATNFNSTTDLKEAVTGADFVNTQIRVGGNSCRVQDEKIPLKHGLIGQETTGVGGFMKALRTIPVMLEIARAVEKYSPNCWIVNYTNPTGLVTEAVTRYTNAKIVGFCSGGIFPKMWAKQGLDIAYERVKYDFVGLNHMNFTYNLKIDGVPATKEQTDAIIRENRDIDPEICELLGSIPSPYLQYYYQTQRKLDQFAKADKTRGEAVMILEKEIYEELADPDNDDKPKSLLKRGGGGYSEVAIGFIEAICNNKDTEMIINVPNNGTIAFLPDDAVVEVNCLVNKGGVYPLTKYNVPKNVWGLIAAVKNYEQLAVEAAVEGDFSKAKQALLAHPLVREYDVAVKVLDELFEANKNFLPQFYAV